MFTVKKPFNDLLKVERLFLYICSGGTVISKKWESLKIVSTSQKTT